MKVLQINSVCGIRSTGRICTDIADILTEQEHESKIAFGRESTVPEKYRKYAVQIGSGNSVRLHALSSRIFDNAGFCSKNVTSDFIKWVKDYDPDIIHLHNIHGYYINAEILFNYLKLSQKPVIWTLHDCWSFTGHCTHFDYVKCGKWETACFECPQKKQYPQSLIIDNSRKNYQKKRELFTSIKNMTIVTPSKWLSELVNRSFLKDYPVKVIPNGIDLTVFRPTESCFREKYGLEDKKIILGVASVWDSRKGFQDFIKLSSILDETYRIVLVGLSENQIKKLPHNIIGISRTNNIKELAELYTAADVFVNPTYEDNFPTVNLEALACGTPVITYNSGGSPESIDDSCGVITAEKSPESLYSSILNLKDYKTGDIIDRARKYDKQGQYTEYINIYNSILEQTK